MRNINKKAKRKCIQFEDPIFVTIIFFLQVRPRVEDTEKGNLSVYKRRAYIWST